MCGWRDSNPHAEAPDPKSGVSTNFTTPAPFEGRKGTRFFSPVNPDVAGVKCAEHLRRSRFPLQCGGTKNVAQPGELDGLPCVGIWQLPRGPNARVRFSPAGKGSLGLDWGRDVGKPADLGRVCAGWSRRLAWCIRDGSCTGWQGVVSNPEHGMAHGGLGDTTRGSRGILDGAMLVVTFSTRDLSLRVAMALGTVKD